MSWQCARHPSRGSGEVQVKETKCPFPGKHEACCPRGGSPWRGRRREITFRVRKTGPPGSAPGLGRHPCAPLQASTLWAPSSFPNLAGESASGSHQEALHLVCGCPADGPSPQVWGTWGPPAPPGCGGSGGRRHPGRLQVSSKRQRRPLIRMATRPAAPVSRETQPSARQLPQQPRGLGCPQGPSPERAAESPGQEQVFHGCGRPSGGGSGGGTPAAEPSVLWVPHSACNEFCHQ